MSSGPVAHTLNRHRSAIRRPRQSAVLPLTEQAPTGETAHTAPVCTHRCVHVYTLGCAHTFPLTHIHLLGVRAGVLAWVWMQWLCLGLRTLKCIYTGLQEVGKSQLNSALLVSWAKRTVRKPGSDVKEQGLILLPFAQASRTH